MPRVVRVCGRVQITIMLFSPLQLGRRFELRGGGSFFQAAMGHLEFIDIFPAIIKTFFFGYVIGIIGCYKGYHASRGTESVGIAANSAVVASSLAVFIIDMIAAQITDLL